MRKFVLSIICLMTILITGCGTGDKKTGVAIALADSTAGLIAWSDAVQVLIDLEEIEKDAGKTQFEANEKLRSGVKQLREKIEQGFSSKDILLKAEEIAKEFDKAQAAGLLGIKSDTGKARYREVSAFAQLSLRTANNILKEWDPPPVPDPVKVEEALQPPAARSAAGALEKWTRFLSIGQDFAFAVIRHNRLDAPGAFAAEKDLNTRLEGLNKDRLSVL